MFGSRSVGCDIRVLGFYSDVMFGRIEVRE